MSLPIRLILISAVLVLVACEADSSAESNQHSQSTNRNTSITDGSSGPGNSETLSDAEKAEQTLKALDEGLTFKLFTDPWTGDLDVMVEKRLIRVLTVYGMPRYFLDDAQEKGLTFELFKMFEKFINEKEKKKHLQVHVVFLPVARDQLIPALLSGRGDIVAAGLTITPEREALVDFTDPVSKELTEVLVTGPSAPLVGSITDLSGQEIYVRVSSSYRSSLDALNVSLKEQGLDEVKLIDAEEMLEDEDLLEMVSSGMLPWAVVDDYKAEIWSQVFDNLTVRPDIQFRSGGRIGYAIRKDSPQLAGALNEFVKTRSQGSLTGNILVNRYLKDYDWANSALAAEDFDRFQSVVDLFAEYGQQYGIDYLLAAAQGYQESRLDQSARSASGAVGIMQLLPSTAADPNVGIADISTAEPNIHAGVKYLNFIRNRYFADPEIDVFNKTMFAFAAYNAGPARVRGLRDKAAQQGYDPNQWFDNVEVIAAKEIGRETVQYVANIIKYYVAYNLVLQQQILREEARKRAGES